MLRIALFLFLFNSLPALLLAQGKAEMEVIEVHIDPDFSPLELDRLIQLLAGKGVKLEFIETGYCDGQLRILSGSVTGPDGNKVNFNTNALRKLTIQLRAQAQALGVQGIRLKNRWRKCEDGQAEEASESRKEMRQRHAL